MLIAAGGTDVAAKPRALDDHGKQHIDFTHLPNLRQSGAVTGVAALVTGAVLQRCFVSPKGQVTAIIVNAI